MSTVVSYISKISYGNQQFKYIDTAPFNFNGTTYRGVIITSNIGSDFIITQRQTDILFHNISVNETQFVVAITNNSFLPAEVKTIIGNANITFLTTVSNLTKWYLTSTAVPASQSDINLKTQSNNVYISTIYGQFIALNQNLPFISNTTPVSFDFNAPDNTNLIIGANTLSGGGGGAGITLLNEFNAGVFSIPFTSGTNGDVISDLNIGNIKFNPLSGNLIVGSIVTNKMGQGNIPRSVDISIGNNALLNSTVDADFNTQNIGIGESALFSMSGNAIDNIAIGRESSYYSIETGDNIAVGYRSLRNNIDGSQNVSIGTKSLTSSVNKSNNTAVGHNAAFSFNISGENITAIGALSLSNNDGINNTAVGSLAGGAGAGTASSNTFVGFAAAANTTEGSENVSVGSYSMYENISGNANVVVGKDAMRGSQNGNANVALGHSALFKNEGFLNVAIGYLAMGVSGISTTSSANIGIGYRSLFSNSTGILNIGIGYDSLYSNQMGEHNIGIGSEALKSNISGNFNIAIGLQCLQSNIEGNYNIGIGGSSLLNNIDGIKNIAIGIDSLRDNTSGQLNISIGNNSQVLGTVSQENISLGHQSLNKNEADFNIAIGNESLYENTTGTQNTAIGTRSLKSNTTGDSNIGIGPSSLISNTIGIENIAIGRESLRSNTTGNYNVAIGRDSQYSNLDGINNISIGTRSLYNNTANYSIAIGVDSLYNNTTGSLNIALGYSSLYANTTGYQNIAVGGDSLNSNSTGNSNIVIGYNSLNTISSGDSNIVIGDTAGQSYTGGDSNNIVLGNNLSGIAGESDVVRIGATTHKATFIPNTLIGYKTSQTFAVSSVLSASNVFNSIVVYTGGPLSSLTFPSGADLTNYINSGASLELYNCFVFTISNTSANSVTLISGLASTIVTSTTLLSMSTRQLTLLYEGSSIWKIY
jgi:hypothetical protein